MSEKPDETKSELVLRVHIEHYKPTEARILGKVLCAFSNEFILFLMSREEYENNRDLALCVKEINRGSMIIDFIINSANSISNIDIELLLSLFFEHLKRISDCCSESMIKIAVLALMFSLKIELFINNKVTNHFNIDVRKAKKIPADGTKEVFDNLEDKLAKLKNNQRDLEDEIDMCFKLLVLIKNAKESNENTGENNEAR
jgi:hypothetical protein